MIDLIKAKRALREQELKALQERFNQTQRQMAALQQQQSLINSMVATQGRIAELDEFIVDDTSVSITPAAPSPEEA